MGLWSHGEKVFGHGFYISVGIPEEVTAFGTADAKIDETQEFRFTVFRGNPARQRGMNAVHVGAAGPTAADFFDGLCI